jgi:hypothetical protein
MDVPRFRNELQQGLHHQTLVASQANSDGMDPTELHRIRMAMDDRNTVWQRVDPAEFELVKESTPREEQQVGGADGRMRAFVVTAKERMVGDEGGSF